MTRNVYQYIEQIVSSLWEAAGQLRTNSKRTSSGYAVPVLGVIFLRHAANRYKAAIDADQTAGKMPKCPLVQSHFVKRRAMILPREAQFDELLKLPVADWSCPWIRDDM
jgi:type I restriction enzyme M protein